MTPCLRSSPIYVWAKVSVASREHSLSSPPARFRAISTASLCTSELADAVELQQPPPPLNHHPLSNTHHSSDASSCHAVLLAKATFSCHGCRMQAAQVNRRLICDA